MSSTKKLSGKKEVTKVTSKDVKELKNSLENMSNLDILEIELDESTIYNLLSNNKNLKEKLSTSKNGTKEKMYKIEVDKNIRRKIRNERNMHIERINLAFQQKDIESTKKFVDAFDKFYKETYTLNDYSISSLGRLNSDKVTLAKLKIMLEIVKLTKSKK